MIVRIAGILLALLLGMSGAGREAAPTAAEDEFIIRVRLDTADEVFMLSCIYRLDGEMAGGGATCSADLKSPLSRTVYETFDERDFPEGADLESFSIRFGLSDRIENGDVPDAAGRTLWAENEIAVPVRFGETCGVVISGDRESGYRAALEESPTAQ